MTAYRLPARTGEWIDRNQTFHFEFEGRQYRACAGDTITSALLANGQTTLGRSFKYHRPRGVMSFANHDVNALLETSTRINIRGDVEPVVEGERYKAVNTFGGLEKDRARFIEKIAAFLPTGFYYKTFYRPAIAFPMWERLIRRLSGLGRIAETFPTTRGVSRRLVCDALVVGGGAAGLAAAQTLLAAGQRVVLVDEHARLGGSLNLESRDTGAQAWRDDTLAQLSAAWGLTTLTGAYAAGYYADGTVPVIQAERMSIVIARTVIIATGAMAQPAVFHNNDLPGVMLASAAQRLVTCFGVAPCRNAVILAANTEAYEAALALREAGISIAAIADLEDPEARGPAAAACAEAGIKILANTQVAAAHASAGVLGAVTLNAAGAAGDAPGQQIACDGLLMSVGWAPAAQLLAQAGGKFEFDEALGQLRPSKLPATVFAAGRVNGQHEFEARVADGRAAATEALSVLGIESAAHARPVADTVRRSHPLPLVEHPKRKNFVDFDEDLQLADLRTSVREGFDGVELMKRYTTNGMGPSQGKHSNVNAARFLARELGQPVGAVGHTTPRPFFHPVPMGVLAGPRWRFHAETPLTDAHNALGASWTEVGVWLRPRHYRAKDANTAIREEYQAVRERAGFIDVSTLGKIEVYGPDAGALLELVYTSRLSRAPVGVTRVVMALDQRGIIADDGIAARLGTHHYYVTAGTGHVVATCREMNQLAALAGLDVTVVDLTRHWGAVNVAGPHARELLQPFTDVDLSLAAFPFPEVRIGQVLDAPARIMRVGFVGESAFEVHLPYSKVPALWAALLERAPSFEARPFGVDTQRLLRLEKGHMIVGLDTDGVMNPFETPLASLVKMDKPQFMGRAACELLQQNPLRQVVGFVTEHSDAARPIEECHLVIDEGRIAGRVTSVAYSPTLKHTVGIAVLEGASMAATEFQIRIGGGKMVRAERSAMPFYDPDNLRLTEASV